MLTGFFFDHILEGAMNTQKIKSSSLQSIERGHRTEIDFLNGYICDHGKEHSILTPVNNAVRAMVLEIEDGKRKMSLTNLNEKAFEEV